jgi:flagellar hook-associated protein 2
MATITSLGVGSGLDLESLVTSLMAVEARPLTALQTKVASYTSKISSLGTLKSKLSALQTAAAAMKTATGKTALSTFASFTASTADTTIATATATTGAVAGTYTLNVTQLAVAQRFESGTFSSTTDTVGSEGDTLTFDFATPDDEGNSRSVTITLDSSNNSLTGLRNAINNANMGVAATIVNGTDGPQLIFTGEEGLDNEITLSGALATQFTEKVSAQNAEFTINGIAATSSTNSASGVLDGVTIGLVKEGTTTLTVAADYSTNITSALNDFITAYNAANSTMTTMGAYNSTTGTAGALQGNQILRDSQTLVRNLLYSTTTGGTSAYQTLSDIGVTVGTDGSLSLDSSKLEGALAADSSAVATLVTKIGESYNSSLESTVGYSGKIKIATDSANTIIKELEERQEALELRLETIEARYRSRFSSLDTLLSSLNNTSTYLTQQLASLTGSSDSSS